MITCWLLLVCTDFNDDADNDCDTQQDADNGFDTQQDADTGFLFGIMKKKTRSFILARNIQVFH